ncbi:MAG: methyl-accepting chemotaxis protein [Gammaproteobacteria bacterium]|nr:methyl-accepting chemotaxis protein [Gammaproteobacteria bacterium]MDH5731061.1 methyl-accepting chemotaxis protein [Gammaproteobacteria bacterium]
MNQMSPLQDTYTVTSKSSRPSLLLLLLILCVILMAASFGYSAIVSQYNRAYISMSGEQRVLALQILRNASEASRAKVEAFPLLQNAHYRFENSLNALVNGDEQSQLPASPTEVQNQLRELSAQWPDFSENVQIILRDEGVIRMLQGFVSAINNVMPSLINATEDVAISLLDSGARSGSIYIASRQLLLAQRMATNVNLVIQGTNDSLNAAKALQNDANEYATVLNAMLNGNRDRGISRITSRQAREKVEKLQPLFDTVRELVQRVLEKSNQLFRSQQASNNIFAQIGPLLAASTQLVDAYVTLDEKRNIYNYIGYVFAALALVLLIGLGGALMRATQIRLRQEAQLNARTQTAIHTLLTEIHPLAQGDLSVHATVGQEVTGAIADAINYAVGALRKLVTSINELSEEVASNAEVTRTVALKLNQASGTQASQITGVSQSINEMAKSLHMVSQHARQSAEVASNALLTAERGAAAVRNTVNSMDTIREDIRLSASRIKRLGESSQEIGDIVELINDIAEQTNILALNAAIQATAAGEKGVGFAMVADQVQQLAERVTQATQQIESLVYSFQVDTGKAVDAMEQSTADVLQGTHLAEIAGDALAKIENVSSHLAELISNISFAANRLSQSANDISASMNTIQDVTSQNLEGAKQTAALTGNLAHLATEQKSKVSGFKLPQ